MTAAIISQPQTDKIQETLPWDHVTYSDEFSEGRRDIMALFIAVTVLAAKSEQLNSEWARQLRNRNFDERVSAAGRMRIAAYCTLAFGILSAAATISGAVVAYRGAIPAVPPATKPGITPSAKAFQSIAEAVSAGAKTGSQVTDQITSYLKGTDDAQAAYTENLLQAAMQAAQAARDAREKAIKDGRDFSDLERQMNQAAQR